MSLTLVYGASPRRLSAFVADHIAHSPAASTSSPTWSWVIGTALAADCCRSALDSPALAPNILTPEAFLAQLALDRFARMRPMGPLESTHLVARLLHKRFSLREVAAVTRLLLRAKENLVFAQIALKRAAPPAFLRAPLFPFPLSLTALYARYQEALQAEARYDSGDLWEYALMESERGALRLPSQPHTLYWDRAPLLSPGTRLLLSSFARRVPGLRVVVTSPFSHRDPEDPFFSPALLELGELADDTQTLSCDTPTPAPQHRVFPTRLKALQQLLILCASENPAPPHTALVSRLPKAEQDFLLQTLSQPFPSLYGHSPETLETGQGEAPLPGWWQAYRQSQGAWQTSPAKTKNEWNDFLYFVEAQREPALSNALPHSVSLSSLEAAYALSPDQVIVPAFQADIVPTTAPIHFSELTPPPDNREWHEIVDSPLYRYWSDRTLLRLFSERGDSALHLFSAPRDLTGRPLSPSPLAEGVFLGAEGGGPLWSTFPPRESGGMGGEYSKGVRPPLCLEKPLPLTLSISQLERFASCPFRFRMAEWESSETEDAALFPKRLRGLAIHRILELAAQKSLPFDALWDETLESLADLSLSKATALLLREEARRAHAQVTPHPLHREWETLAVEWPFAIPFDAPWGPVSVRGRVDRILAHPDTSALLVIDYKTAPLPFTLKAIHSGEALQLPLYLAAAQAQFGPHRPVAGAMVWDLANGEIRQGMLDRALDCAALSLSKRSGAWATAEALETWMARGKEQVTALLSAIAASDFAPKPRDRGFCRRACAWRRSCGYPWMDPVPTQDRQ